MKRNKLTFFYVQQHIEQQYTTNQFYRKIIDYFKDVCITKNLPVYIVNKVLSKIDYQYSEEVEKI